MFMVSRRQDQNELEMMLTQPVPKVCPRRTRQFFKRKEIEHIFYIKNVNTQMSKENIVTHHVYENR